MNDKELLAILKISRRWHMLNSVCIWVLATAFAFHLHFEDAGAARWRAWVQIGWSDKHFDITADAPHAVIFWHYWKGDEGASFGTRYTDGSIIAYGYWPNCRWNSTPSSSLPVPYCGWKQPDFVAPY